MKKVFLTSFLLLATLQNSFGCLNGDTRQLKDGTIISLDAGYIVPNGYKFFSLNYSERLHRLDSLWKATGDIDYLSDYGIVLILQKEYLKAKDVYLKIEKIKPNRYSTASNLGTVYELLGQNDNALKWINKAIAINPSSHRNSEWLHAKILEAKIKGEQFITSDFLLNTNFGTQANPKSNLSNAELLKLRDVLYYQLNERISFIKPKDKIVAQLLFDLGNICMLTKEKSAVGIVYYKAKEYGFSEPILQLRLDNTKDIKQQKQQANTSKSNTSNYIALGLICALVLIFLIAKILTKKKGNH